MKDGLLLAFVYTTEHGGLYSTVTVCLECVEVSATAYEVTSSGPSRVGPFGHLESFGSFNHLEGSKRETKGKHPEGEAVPSTLWLLELHPLFPDGNPRRPNSHADVQAKMWVPGPPQTQTAAVSSFTFERVRDESRVVLQVKFGPIDGPGGALGSASTSHTDATITLDDTTSWTVGAVPGSYDLESVATHEIGHILGLDHSQVEEGTKQTQQRL
ncbi:hypothetical protein AAG906_004004 [Vitis piasezkii]